MKLAILLFLLMALVSLSLAAPTDPSIQSVDGSLQPKEINLFDVDQQRTFCGPFGITAFCRLGCIVQGFRTGICEAGQCTCSY